ncbi:hypothetical protein [Micromonospora sp. ATCC 39149]|nr:hypothetical protein [Micromonospora sp. ATCC 39149]
MNQPSARHERGEAMFQQVFGHERGEAMFQQVFGREPRPGSHPEFLHRT